jgi:hypothetical protein
MRRQIPIFILLLALILCTSPGTGQTGNGYYQVESQPSDAQVLVDNIYRGNTPVTVAVPSTGPATHTVIVTKSGYYPFTRTYDTSPAPGETIGVLAVLEPSSHFGNLAVVSMPSGALITIDGGSGQMSPWTYTDIPAGSHIVRAFLSGYQPYISLANVPPDGTITVEARLLPLSEVGVIQVKSSPGGADVYIDGFYSGATSTTIGNLAAGPHFVQLRLAGYDEWINTVQVLPNQVTIIDATLEVASTAQTGSISISSVPSGATVYIDNSYQGITQPANPLDLTNVAAGDHVVRLELANYQDFTTNVKVESGKIAVVNAVMVPATNPSSSGTLQVNSVPQGANVLVDNIYRGITPLTLSSVDAGSHSLLVRLAGYNDYTSTVTIAPGEVIQVEADLNPVPTQTGLPVLLPPISLLLTWVLVTKRT